MTLFYTICRGNRVREESGWKQTKMEWWNPRGVFFFSKSRPWKKATSLGWNVVLWRFTFFRAIEETDFQMITTDYFFFLMIVGKFCCVLIKEEKFIYVVTIALIMNAWRLIWLDRWIIDNFNILPQTTSKEQGQNSVL